jgi:DNA-directed RNA polymerase subunit K/omega
MTDELQTLQEILLENTGTPADLVDGHVGGYLLINALSKRVHQLQSGDRAMIPVSVEGARDHVRIAIEEFRQNKVLIIPRVVSEIEYVEQADSSPFADAPEFNQLATGTDDDFSEDSGFSVGTSDAPIGED